MNKIKICFLNKKSGVHYHRLQIPFSNLNEDYEEFEITSSNGFTLEFSPSKFDVIVLNRYLFQDEDYLKKAKDYGVKIILDLDDDITIPEWHGSYFPLYNEVIKDKIIYSIEIADSVWIASKYLLNKIAKQFPESSSKLVYVPNAIDSKQPQFIPLTGEDKLNKKNSLYTIGWLGGSNHHLDLDLLYDSFGRLLEEKKLKDKYNIMLGGYSDKSLEYWNYIEQIFTSNGNLPMNNYIRVEAQDIYNYGFMYNLCDVMLAPLVDNEFSRCKSNIKILEAAAFGLPVICSNVEPYKEFISKGLVMQGDVNCDKHIKNLIKNPKLGKTMSNRLNEYCREHYGIQLINKIRYENIKTIL